jgi:hypothetical protein
MPCRWHCVPQRLGGGILRLCAGILPTSRRAPLRPAQNPFFPVGFHKLYQILNMRMVKLFARKQHNS